MGFIQLKISESSPRQNFNILLKQIRMLIKKKPALIMLPEICLGGTQKQNERDSYANIYAEFTCQLKTLCQEQALWIYGSVLEKSRARFFNTALLISPQGRIKACYRKIHLFHHENEQHIFSAGKKTVLTQAPWGKTGLTICYDLRFPELLRKLTGLGLRVALVCAQWPEARRQHWLTLLQARAIENQVFVLACNRRGKKRDLAYSGDSCVISPWGEILLHLKKNQTRGICEIDLNEVERVRKKYPFLKDRRLG